MEELAIKNAAPKTAELFRKKLNFVFCFLVVIICVAIKLQWQFTLSSSKCSLVQYNFTQHFF
jgi:hypothetical protein